ncbi:MAG: hypothetical protein HPY69_14130 [Armatimonadetes bacterium]|nr:hypothetical protein [Armatimonadota bacterium]
MAPFMLLVAASAMAVAAAAPEPIALTVRNHTGVALQAAPVRGGVPFPRGVWLDSTVARLTGADGRALPCQTRPIAHWYDGSVKWLLVDTQVDLPVAAEAALRLEAGEAPAVAGPRVRTLDRDDDVVVETGAARYVFSKRTFALPGAVALDANGDGTYDQDIVTQPGQFVCEVEHQPPGEPQEENWLRDAAGGPRERFTAGPAGEHRCEVESANDLHAVVKLSGWLVNGAGRRLIQYFIRAHAYAGRPELKLQVSFVYAGNPKQDFTRALYLTFPRLGGGKVDWALGGQTVHAGQVQGAESASLTEIGPEKIYHLAPYTQDKSVTYQVTQGNQVLAYGKEAAGWAQVSDGRGCQQLAVRDFWQMHPKELRVAPDGITAYLWPERGGKVLDLRRRYDYVENTYHYDLSLWEYGGEGVGVTHEMVLRFAPQVDEAAPRLTAALNAPLLLECEPAYYAASGAFGPFAVADPTAYPRLEGLQNVDVEWIRRNQAIFHWDGMIDYGDTLFHGYNTPSHYGYVAEKGWCSRGYVGWLNDDGTLTHGLFLQYLRTGDYPTFLTAANMARHSMDVDVCHYCAAEPRQVGGGHRHDQQHWGNGVRGYGAATQGIMDLYLLTGDERALDVARERAQYHDVGIPAEDEQRIGGLYRFWEITGEDHWRQRAAELLAEELNVPADQDWRFVTAPHFRFVSDTSVSLMYYLCAASPEEAAPLREAVVRSADSYYDKALSTWEDAGYLPMLLCVMAYEVTGNRKYALEAAGLLQRLRLPTVATVSEGFLEMLRGLAFEELVDVAIRQWNTNNVYMIAIQHFAPLPYVLEMMRREGMDETAIFDPSFRVANKPPAFEEVIAPESISQEIGFCFIAGLKQGAPSDISGGHSDLVLLEDGRPLGPAHAAHADIRKTGGGLYSHWGAHTVYFSTSDNTDPRTNGREYKVVYPGP